MQFSDRIGRIWRLKLIGSAAQAAPRKTPRKRVAWEGMGMGQGAEEGCSAD